MQESIYLDTSVPSAYYDDRAKERQEATIVFWGNVIPNYKVFVSEITLEELARTYVKHDIIPGKYIYDAYHAAIATYHHINFLISWNFDHLVKTRKMLNSVNILEGFTPIEIISPQEL